MLLAHFLLIVPLSVWKHFEPVVVSNPELGIAGDVKGSIAPLRIG